MPVSLSTTTVYVLGPDQQVPDQPVELYRRTVPFALQTMGLAEQIVVDAAASSFSGQFLSYSYDARALTSTSLQDKGANTVLVTFEAPRRVRKVKTTPGTQVGLHRVDVDKVVDDATVTLANNSAVSPTFADARFAIRLSSGGALAPAQIEVLEVTSFPSSPRLGITLTGVTPPVEPVYFGQGSGEIGQGGEPEDGRIGDGAALAAALERLLNRHLAGLRDGGQPIPAQIGAALLIESSAPCRFQLETLSVVYRVVTESWLGLAGDAAQAKEVLRFSSQHLDGATLPLALPAGVTVQAATLRVVASQAAAQATPGATDAEDDAFPPPVQTTGFYVDHRAVALAVTPPAALTATGLAVAVLPLSSELTLQLALYGDANGVPAGAELVSTIVGGEPAGRRRWVTGRLPAPLPLSSQRVWLVLRAQTGACIWLAAPGDAPAGGALITGQSEIGSAWERRAAGSLPGLAHHLLSPALTGPPGLAVPAAQPTLTASLGGVPLADLQDGDTHRFDLAPAWAAFLQTDPIPGATGLVGMALVFEALGLRQATVYPPRLEFAPDSG